MNKSVLRALDILLLIAKAKKAMNLTEIGSKLGMPKSSTYDLVYTLLEKGFLIKEGEKKFNLGLTNFELGSAYINQISLVDIAKVHLKKLALEVNNTVFLAIVDDGQLVYMDKHIGNSTIAHTCEIGSRNYMYCTGLGKALLAAYPDKKVEDIATKYPWIKKTQNTIDNIDDLKKDLENIRKRGYSIDDREGDDDIFCIAAPIYSVGKEPIAAISVAAFAHTMDDQKIELFSDLIIRNAMHISRELGFNGDRLYPGSSGA